jgi:hypothetical protein
MRRSRKAYSMPGLISAVGDFRGNFDLERQSKLRNYGKYDQL